MTETAGAIVHARLRGELKESPQMNIGKENRLDKQAVRNSHTEKSGGGRKKGAGREGIKRQQIDANDRITKAGGICAIQ